jgi:RNA polymerase sigma-70 factor (ECF subfamily)
MTVTRQTPLCTSPAPSPGEAEDRRALAAMGRGDLSRLDPFLNAHKLPLMRFLHHQLRGDDHTAEDLTQEVFLRAIRAARAGRFDGRASVRTWLFQIARNCLIDHARRAELRRAQPECEAAAAARPSAAPGPLALAMEEEGERRVHELLRRLPEPQGQVLAMKVLGGLTVSEIADVIGEPVETVKSRLRYALEKVRHLLLPEGVTGHA